MGSINPLNMNMVVRDFIPRGFEEGPQIAAAITIQNMIFDQKIVGLSL